MAELEPVPPVRLFGAPYSVYVRAARLALEEKGVAYELVPVDVFAPGGPPAEHLARHPFGKIPALEWDGFQLYETGAILRLVDEAFPGPPLQPDDVFDRARMNQGLGVLDAYAYPHLVWGVFFERIQAPLRSGRPADEARIAAVLPKAATCLAALEALLADRPWLAGEAVSLADLLAIPMFAYFALADEAAGLMAPHPRLTAWWERARERPSVGRTRPDINHARFSAMT